MFNLVIVILLLKHISDKNLSTMRQIAVIYRSAVAIYQGQQEEKLDNFLFFSMVGNITSIKKG